MPPEQWHPPISLSLISPTNVCDVTQDITLWGD
jgi:hypothetical protein